MRLRAGCDITIRAPVPTALVAMLRPRSGDAQWVSSESYHFDPPVRAMEYVDSFGNLCQRLTVPAQSFRIQTESVVETDDEISVCPGAPRTPPHDLPNYTLQYLLPSRYCPSDRLVDLAREVTAGNADGYDQAEAIRAWIRSNIAYRYGVSDVSTSALETLQDGAGVCRDYSHIGLSLCRALFIPARIVVGYLHQLDPMDLHAWFEAFVDGRWYTFDAPQDEPRGGRIAIAYGRDAADVALITEIGELRTESIRVRVDRA